MLEDFKRALARVQSDYEFYVECQESPGVALAGYELSEEERSTLLDPEKLATALDKGIGLAELRPSITVKISGSHDWINVAATDVAADQAHAAKVATQIDSIEKARSREERAGATLRLMELLG